MSENISVAEGALRRGADAVIGARDDINQSVGRVLAELDQLAAYWQGNASQSFQNLVTTWSNDAKRLNDVLTHLHDALRGTERDQAAIEEQHQATISGLSGMMGGNS